MHHPLAPPRCMLVTGVPCKTPKLRHLVLLQVQGTGLVQQLPCGVRTILMQQHSALHRKAPSYDADTYPSLRLHSTLDPDSIWRLTRGCDNAAAVFDRQALQHSLHINPTVGVRDQALQPTGKCVAIARTPVRAASQHDSMMLVPRPIQGCTTTILCEGQGARYC
jgi:hypothetical protein